LSSKELVEKIVHCALDKKAADLVVLDLHEISSICDYFIICTVESTPQVKAVFEHVEAELKQENTRVWHIEGTGNLQWVLMDYVDVVVHIFLPEVREFYSLERLWNDAPRVEIQENAENLP
jgi:ribosome-associated protein